MDQSVVDVKAEVERVRNGRRSLLVGLMLVGLAGCSSDAADLSTFTTAPITFGTDSSILSTTTRPPSVPADRPESQCGGNTQMYEQCVGAVFEAIEAERVVLLTTLLDQAAGPYQEPRRADGLRSAERAFVAYREQTCDSVYLEFIGGTIRGAAALLCSIDLARDHNQFLSKRVIR